MTNTSPRIKIKSEDITQKILEGLENGVDNSIQELNKTESLIRDIKSNVLRILKLNWSGHRRTPDGFDIGGNKTIVLTRNGVVQVMDEETGAISVVGEYRRTRKYSGQSKTDHEMILFLEEKPSK